MPDTRTIVANLWNVESVPGGGVWLKQYPYGHGVRMSSLGTRELAQALLDAAEMSEATASGQEQKP
jgi:hypothetical protein